MQNDTNLRTKATAVLAEIFFNSSINSLDMAEFEAAAIDIGHQCIAEAMGLALEALDEKLFKERASGLKVHDKRSRCLLTEVGDVNFSFRRYRDAFGNSVYPLAEKLDIPYGSRVSPGASEFLIEASAHVSYQKAANLLARHGSVIRPTSVMQCLRTAGLLCAEEDEQAAISLYRDGVLPDSAEVSEELCMEADGTYFRAQGLTKGQRTRFEVKALVAYKGKRVEGGKVRRLGCVHHALVGTPNELWSEGVAAIGKKYDLSKIERVHLGGDGEKWCRNAERYLPKAEVTFHLDKFHVNQAIMACFRDKKIAWNIIEVINNGDKNEAIALLKAASEYGIAKENVTPAVINYLEGNIKHIAIEGPSLGTMESENQHLYGVRMDSFPCAWSLRGASDMARIISRRETKTEIPKMTREKSIGIRRREKRERKELSFYEHQGGSGKMIQCSCQGYLPPHQVNTRRMKSGHAYALYKGMALLDRRP